MDIYNIGTLKKWRKKHARKKQACKCLALKTLWERDSSATRSVHLPPNNNDVKSASYINDLKKKWVFTCTLCNIFKFLNISLCPERCWCMSPWQQDKQTKLRCGEVPCTGFSLEAEGTCSEQLAPQHTVRIPVASAARHHTSKIAFFLQSPEFTLTKENKYLYPLQDPAKLPRALNPMEPFSLTTSRHSPSCPSIGVTPDLIRLVIISWLSHCRLLVSDLIGLDWN